MKKFLFITLISFLASCTITKRIHNPGWHVEWKTNHSSLKEREFSVNDQFMVVGQTQSELSISASNVEEIHAETQDANYNQNSGDDLNSMDKAVRPVKKSNGTQIHLVPKSITTSNLYPTNDGEMGKLIHPFVYVAGIFLILMILIAILALLLNPAILGFIRYAAIPGLVFSILGLVKTVKNRDQYCGLGFFILYLVLFAVPLIIALGSVFLLVFTGW